MQDEVKVGGNPKLLEPGEMFGDYTVEKLLGKGGMGAAGAGARRGRLPRLRARHVRRAREVPCRIAKGRLRFTADVAADSAAFLYEIVR